MPPLSIRAVPGAGGTASPAAPSVPGARPPGGEEPRVRRVESVVGREQSGGWRRLAQVVVGGGGPSRQDGLEADEARARTPFTGSRRVVVLGCTGGAGQTTTALMLGHTLARYRDGRVLAVDAGVGDHTMTGRIAAESPESLTSLMACLDGISGYLSMRSYTTRCDSGLEVIGSDADAAAARRLADRGLFSERRLAAAMRVLDRHYNLIVVDPAAAVAARMLPHADQLILVAPASEDAPDAVAMTFDWLDGHGSVELRRRAIMVVNGVSRRSMAGVEQAEAVARGRCRAIVRVPWEDELAPGRPGPAQPGHLRPGGRRAYVALAGVVVSGLAAIRRPSEEEVAQ
ncbi:AAA family ATPase [Sphaerisporangium rufum]|uniref:AAA family ATPase n=1 Tax=Sphaerisporangium rufum TaxID=1381558 RepID=UPI001951EE09|nr:AAA family ATPase [Sphaerisporangium rufum]